MTSAEPLPGQVIAPQTPLARRRIVVVDDTRAAALILGRLLESLGQEVHVCFEARSAFELSRQILPDVIFSDISMPEVDGYQFARQLRADTALKDVTLVAMTGYGLESDRQLAHQAGFDHHLVKPISKQALQELLLSTAGA
ncbi:MAG: response regulator [Aureliella sp.]